MTVRSILEEMFPGDKLRNDVVVKLEQVRSLLVTAVPLPAQFHMQQSMVKGLFFAGFRLLFRPAAMAVSSKRSLTADLPYAVVDHQFRLILQACADDSLRIPLTLAAQSPDPWPLFMTHYVQKMMPMALSVQDAFRSKFSSHSLLRLEIFLTQLLLGFAEIGKWHYRNCVVYLLSQISHFEKYQKSVYSYLYRKFGDLNEVTIEYYHAYVCTFTSNGMSPVEVERNAKVVDAVREDLDGARKYLFGGSKIKYRPSRKFNPEDPLVQRELEDVKLALMDILRYLEQTASNGSLPREFLLDVLLSSSRGELFYKSKVFEVVECRLLGLAYIPHCAILCAVCSLQLARPRPKSDCLTPICEVCASTHKCAKECATRPDLFATAHLCAGCGIPVFRGAALLALQAQAAAEAHAASARFGADCAHILCASCAASTSPSEPCARCAVVFDGCLSDAVEHATDMFSAARGRSFWKTLRRLLVPHCPADDDAGPSQCDHGQDELSIDSSFACSTEEVVLPSIAPQIIAAMTSSGATDTAAPADSIPIDARLGQMKLSGASSLKKAVSMYAGSYPGSRFIPQVRSFVSTRCVKRAPRSAAVAAVAAAAAADDDDDNDNDDEVTSK
jgi:hypothetical protein